MSKTLKIVLGVIFTFTAIFYLVNIGAKSFEDANSIGRLISHLVIGVLVGGLIALDLLQAESQQHIAANRWVTVKLNDHFNAIFITGIVSILAVGISKSAHEVTKSPWYLANEISNKGVEICEEYESSVQVEKSYDKLIKATREHYSSAEILLMACESAQEMKENEELYVLKAALMNVELGRVQTVNASFSKLQHTENQEKLISKLVNFDFLIEAASLVDSIQDKNSKAWLLNKIAGKYYKNNNYEQAKVIYEYLRQEHYQYGYYGLVRLYEDSGKPQKSVELLHELLEKEENYELDASSTYAWLGYYYYNGIGVAKDIASARKYYENGLTKLPESTKLILADMYYNGVGGEFKRQEAIELGYVTPEMKKIKDIKNGKGVIVRGSYMCETYSSIQRLTQLEKSYGGLQYISRAIPADCFDLIQTLNEMGGRVTGDIAIQKVTQERNSFLQIEIKNSRGKATWMNLEHIVVN